MWWQKERVFPPQPPGGRGDVNTSRVDGFQLRCGAETRRPRRPPGGQSVCASSTAIDGVDELLVLHGELQEIDGTGPRSPAGCRRAAG